MARRLSAARRARRFVGAALLVAMVLALHLVVTRQVAQSLADFVRAGEMPERIRVTYVRELELAPPPVAAPVVVAPPARAPTTAATPAALPASAPQPEPAPQPQPQPTADDEAALRARALAWAAAQAASAAAAKAPPPAESTAALSPPSAAAASASAASDAATALAAAGPASAASDAMAQAFDWPVSTRLTYALSGNYRGEVLGDAQVEWVRVGSRYQVHVDVGIGARFAPIITRRMSSEGELVGDSLHPTRYDEDTRVLMRKPRRLTILLGPDEILLPNGEKLARAAGVQDAASQFIQLAAHFTTHPELLQAGNTIDMLIALRNRVGLFTYDVMGLEETATPFGTLQTAHLKPRDIKDRGNVLTAEIWFAPQLRYLPVRIRIEQDADTYIDLVIARRPEIAAQ
jgi:outer membrane biosynthesis protein TonB